MVKLSPEVHIDVYLNLFSLRRLLIEPAKHSLFLHRVPVSCLEFDGHENINTSLLLQIFVVFVTSKQNWRL